MTPEDPSPTRDEALRALVEARIPFNRLLGLSVASLEPGRPRIRFHKREELVGNFVVGSLHGGVISSVLDAVGGLAAFLVILGRIREEGTEPASSEALERLARVGTIDLRIDYLHPANADAFTASASVLRAGGRVVVARMDLREDGGGRVAVGTGTYMLG